jgi:hypothetical protein
MSTISSLPWDKGEISGIFDREAIARLRHAGFAIIPLRPTKEMIAVGAPHCFSVPTGTVEASLSDAENCYRAMVELGCL